MKFLCATLVILLGIASVRADQTPLRKLGKAELAERMANDEQAVLVYRDGLLAATAFIRQQTNLFPEIKGDYLVRREDKEILWQVWLNYLDYLLALDSMDHFYSDWYQLSGAPQKQAFDLSHAAFLAKYRAALEFIPLIEKNPMLDKVLNEPVPEIGLPAGTYAKLKFRFLNVGTALNYVAQGTMYPSMRGVAPTNLQAAIAADSAAILKAGGGQGELLTAKNALEILQNAGNTAWFPVQMGVSEWMGHTKVHRQNEFLISPEQIAQLHDKLLPGDVLLVRREWFLSNVGLPGFWPHAALYIGTPEERQKYFSDGSLTNWLNQQNETDGDFEKLLQARAPTNYDKSLKPQPDNHQARVIEAMSAGVLFTALEHCANADSVVVLRPLLPKSDKAEAILRAFHYAGRPYDFEFDFATDSKLVCTELVYKSYEPAADMKGLNLPLETMLGRELLPANLIARQFDQQYGTTNVQFDFVAFLDGYERGGKAVDSNVDEFRQSWQRPKWNILVQKAPQ
jgi:hypothetical protein